MAAIFFRVVQGGVVGKGLNTIIHKKHLSHFMGKTMNELAHKSPLILSLIINTACMNSSLKI